MTASQIEKKNSTGQDLYYANCASCHGFNMIDNLTGPALGGITERRSKKWIYAFTKNSTKMIAAGDKDAVKIFQQYHEMTMSNFEFLKDDELDAIYFYIETTYKKNKK